MLIVILDCNGPGWKMTKKHFNLKAAAGRNTAVREKEVERYLTQQTKKRLGGTARKYNSPGRAAEPDRLLTWLSWRGFCAFVECKRPGEKPTPAQNKAMDSLKEEGQLVYWVDSKGAVDRLLDILELL